jgi:predicted nucleic acid-binding protein
LVYTPENIKEGLFEIRDKKDYPILYTAIVENVDVILTGDADFKATDISHPEIVTPTEFLERF